MFVGLAGRNGVARQAVPSLMHGRQGRGRSWSSARLRSVVRGADVRAPVIGHPLPDESGAMIGPQSPDYTQTEESPEMSIRKAVSSTLGRVAARTFYPLAAFHLYAATACSVDGSRR